MTKYRQKPITAIQWTGNNIEEIKNFVVSAVEKCPSEVDALFITFPKVNMTLSKGDYLIKELDNTYSSMTENRFLNEYVKESGNIGKGRGARLMRLG